MDPRYDRRAKLLDSAYVVSFLAQLAFVLAAAVGFILMVVQGIHALSVATGVIGLIGFVGCEVFRRIAKRWFRKRWPAPTEQPEGKQREDSRG